jgi:hypothetical protein
VPFLVLRGTAAGDGAVKVRAEPGRVRRAMAMPVFWLLAVSYAAHSFMFTGLTFHIIPLLTERGFAAPMIIAAYALVGPFQVIGRIVVFALETRINVRLAGLVATALPVIGMGLLLAAKPDSILLYFFAALYGSGMGIKTIVQATAGPEFLGREGYGALQGTFAGITYAVQAATPLALAALWAFMGGYDQVLLLLLASAALSVAAFMGAMMMPRSIILEAP